jgi:hypothetical protein
MSRVGYWTYWFASKTGFDLDFTKNKKNIPHGYKSVMHFRVDKPDGNIDSELIVNGKTVWIRKNINKLDECAKMQYGYEIQREIHKLLDVKYPDKEYKKIFEKKVKGCKIK